MSEIHLSKPNIRISEEHLNVYKTVIRVLGSPAYITLLENEKRHTLAIIPCDEKYEMAFKVPEDLLTRRKAEFRIHSKEFIQHLRERNCLGQDESCVLEGQYVEKLNAVIFHFHCYRYYGFVVYENE